MQINFNGVKSAGADCMGFVDRAHSYKDQPYVWPKLPKADRAEGEINPDRISRDANPLPYPLAIAGAAIEIVKRGDIKDGDSLNYYTQSVGAPGGPTVDDFAALKNLFRHVLPGDVVSYGREDPTIRYRHHIGIITSSTRTSSSRRRGYRMSSLRSIL